MALDLSWKVGINSRLVSLASPCLNLKSRRENLVWLLGLLLMMCWAMLQGPSRIWEQLLLSLGAAGSRPGIEGEEIAPLAKENVATP